MKKITLLLIVFTIALVGCNKQPPLRELDNPSLPPQKSALPPDSLSSPNEPESTVISSEQKDEEEYEVIMLYHGITLNIDDQIMDNEDIGYSKYLEKKYNREYDFYENGKWISRGESHVESRGLDFYWYVPSSEIGFVGGYDPYPRLYDICSSNEFCTLLISDIKSRFEIEADVTKVLSIDLDGDGEVEYIAHAQSSTTYAQFVCLLSQHGEIISYLLACTDDEVAMNLGIENKWTYDLENDMEIIDIDNDDCMEMIVTKIVFEGFSFDIYRYDGGVFSGGQFINMCSVAP